MLGPDSGTACVFSASAAPNTDGMGMPQQSPQPPASRAAGSEWSCPHCDSSCRSRNSPSQVRIEPNRKCWTTGSFPKTSARYIFTIPSFTLSQVLTYERVSCNNLTWAVVLLTADMSSSIGLCHRNEAVFIYQGDEPRNQRQKHNGAYRVDEFYARKVHIIFCVLVDQFVIVN